MWGRGAPWASLLPRCAAGTANYAAAWSDRSIPSSRSSGAQEWKFRYLSQMVDIIKAKIATPLLTMTVLSPPLQLLIVDCDDVVIV